MSNTERALLAAVRENPADDLPRLVLADWIEENGEPERAEFVRVQCEIARLERRQTELLNDDTDWGRCTDPSANWCPNCGDCSCRNPEDSKSDKGCPLHDPGSDHGCKEELGWKLIALRRRERELLDEHWSEWIRGAGLVPDGWKLSTDGDSFHVWRDEPFDDGFRFQFRRGFVGSVSLPLAAFAGGPCGACGGADQWEEGDDDARDPCPVCDNDPNYRTPGVAKALFAAQPVTAVTLTDDLDLHELLPGHWVFRDSEDDDPEEIVRVLDRTHPTRAAALDALSAACVAHGRELTGLPPLAGSPAAGGRCGRDGRTGQAADGEPEAVRRRTDIRLRTGRA